MCTSSFYPRRRRQRAATTAARATAGGAEPSERRGLCADPHLSPRPGEVVQKQGDEVYQVAVSNVTEFHITVDLNLVFLFYKPGI